MEGGQKISLIPEHLQQLDSFLLVTATRFHVLFVQVGLEIRKRRMWLYMNIENSSKHVFFVQGVYGGNILEKTPALTGGYDLCEQYMGSRKYSQNNIKFRLQPPKYTSRPLQSEEERTAHKREGVRLRSFNGR